MSKVNRSAFWLSVVCALLFFSISFSSPIDKAVIGVHPLTFLLFMTIATFFLAMLGFSGAKNGFGYVRSIVTVIITLSLSVLLAVIVFFGRLLS